jgi:hypothetical protein
MDDALRISASEFKARCLAIFKDLEARRVARVLVTRRGPSGRRAGAAAHLAADALGRASRLG